MRKWRKRSEEKQKEESQRDKLAYPLTPDRTAVETHYNRSRKIRLRVYEYLKETATQKRSFADRSDLANQTANSARCAYETSARWINQYTSRNGDFYYYEDDHRLGWKRSVEDQERK
ncbi:MAG: hypothetical protein V3T23_13490 [Nitrososphaerales archaeon]